MAKKLLSLDNDEYEHIITTLEGAREEFVELEDKVDWFVSLTTDRLLDCLQILRGARNV